MSSMFADAGAWIKRGTGWRIRSQPDIQRRKQRLNSVGQHFLRTPNFHNGCWMSVPRKFKQDSKKFLQSKICKSLRETSTGSSAHHLRDASRRAQQSGVISNSVAASDDLLNKQANIAKHRTTAEQKRWAQTRLAATDAASSSLADCGVPSCSASSLPLAAVGATAWADIFDDDVDATYEKLFPPLSNSETIDEHVVKDSDLQGDMPTDTLHGQHSCQPIVFGGNEDKFDNNQYWTAQVAALRFENGHFFEQLTTVRQELGLARSQIHNAEVALQAWMHHASCLEFRNHELQSHPLVEGKVSEAPDEAIGQLQRSSDSELPFTSVISQPLSLTSYQLHSGSDSELRQELMNHVGNGDNILVIGSKNTEELVLQTEPTQQLQKGLQDLWDDFQRNLFWQRTENEIALQEQRRSDEELAGLTKRIVELEESWHQGKIQALRDEFRAEWHTSLQAMRDAFQARLDRLEAGDRLDDLPNLVHCEIDRHMFDRRLLELSRKLQDCHSHLLVFDSKVQEAVCDSLQSGAGSELLLRMKRLEEQVDQLQSSADSTELKKELMNQAGNNGSEFVDAEPPQRSVAELQAVFERLQICPPPKAHLPVSSAASLVPLVDMGIYVSNSIHFETSTFKHDKGEGGHSDHVGPGSFKHRLSALKHSQHNEASSFKQRRTFADTDSFDDSEDGRSETESQKFTQRLIEEGYDPNDIGYDSPLHTDDEQGYDSDPTDEPWA